MSTISTSTIPNEVRPGALHQVRRAVPWSTVLPLAIVMAYADGFWLTSLRGAVGAIERTQEPFASWWRESTLALPFFVLAVLGVVTLAQRWFGPAPRAPKMLATLVLIVAAGTVVGMGQIVLSSAYDYHLQSVQLQMMDTMRSMCTGGCLKQAQHDTLALHVRAVLYVSRWVILTNLVLATWIVAMRGGRLRVSTIRPQPSGQAAERRRTGGRVRDVRLLLVAALLAAAAIHAAVISEHLTEWTAAGVFFILLTAAELAVAGMLLVARLQRVALLAAVVISIGPLVIWAVSRTVGLPFGPDPGVPEAVGLPDIAACLVEVGALVVAVLLLRATGWLGRRPPASAHVKAMALVALTAVTAIGLAGTGPAWFEVAGISPGQPGMTMTH